MRYELSDYEWTAIKPMLPNKPRGVRRVDDRRVLNGIFWVLRSGAPWRDLPETYGPRTTCYNRFVRWRQAGVWDQIMDALAAGQDAAVQMVDTSVVRVHQHGACIADNNSRPPWRSIKFTFETATNGRGLAAEAFLHWASIQIAFPLRFRDACLAASSSLTLLSGVASHPKTLQPWYACEASISRSISFSTDGPEACCSRPRA
jgi:transposase